MNPDVLRRSADLLSLLEQHLRPTPASVPDPLIESVVVNYMLTVIYADIEIAVHAELAAYGARTLDPRMSSFVTSAARRVVRSVRCSELSGVLNMFDEDCKRHFQSIVNDTAAQTAFDRVMSGRQDQAHALGSDLTLSDVKRDMKHCKAVLQAFADGLACSCSHS